ncbi:MAG: DoxX family membrane protein [Bacteroidia bacterium]|nr:DoxX family membrane protein [Bacteroidia bacterium]
MMDDTKMALAELLVRVVAGILFFFQGFDKLFNIKMDEVIGTFMQDAQRRHIPRPLVAFISYLTSIIELVGGLLLILGLFSFYASAALCVDLMLITLAFSMMQPMWDLRHVFPRILLLVLILFLLNYNLYSLDYYFNL